MMVERSGNPDKHKIVVVVGARCPRGRGVQGGEMSIGARCLVPSVAPLGVRNSVPIIAIAKVGCAPPIAIGTHVATKQNDNIKCINY